MARAAGATPVIPGRRNRRRAICYDKHRYRGRHLIKNAFCRLKDFHRVPTRYDKLAANFLSGVALATTIALATAIATAIAIAIAVAIAIWL